MHHTQIRKPKCSLFLLQVCFLSWLDCGRSDITIWSASKNISAKLKKNRDLEYAPLITFDHLNSCVETPGSWSVLQFVLKTSFSVSQLRGFCVKGVHCESQFQRKTTNTDLSQAICKTGLLTEIQEAAENNQTQRHSQEAGCNLKQSRGRSSGVKERHGEESPRGWEHVVWCKMPCVWYLNCLQLFLTCTKFPEGTGNGMFLQLDVQLS